MNKLEIRWHVDEQPCYLAKVLDTILTQPVKSQSSDYAYIIGREQNAKRIHLQGVIYTYMSKDTFRARFKQETKVSGNKDYSIALVRNEESALSYTTKEGNFVLSTDFEEIVRPVSAIKPWKEDETSFRDLVKELDQRYLDSDMDDSSYLDALLTIYADKGPKNLMLHHVRSHWLSLFNRRNRLSVRRTFTITGYVEEQFRPRQVLVSHIKNFLRDN